MTKPINYPDKPPARMLNKQSIGFAGAIEYICHRLSDDERVQAVACSGGDPLKDEYDAGIAIRHFISASGQGPAFFYLDRDKMPCAAGGYVADPVFPGVWQSWMIGTQAAWENEWKGLTHGARWLIKELMDGGARRLETTVLASRTDAQKWYANFLGMQHEGVRRGITVAGEDVLLYGFTKEDWHVRWG